MVPIASGDGPIFTCSQMARLNKQKVLFFLVKEDMREKTDMLKSKKRMWRGKISENKTYMVITHYIHA